MNDEKRHRVSPSMTARARKLRREATFPERLLWSRLKAKKLPDIHFRRQHAIGHFICDFARLEARLIIELDGHTTMDRRRAILNANRFFVARDLKSFVLEMTK